MEALIDAELGMPAQIIFNKYSDMLNKCAAIHSGALCDSKDIEKYGRYCMENGFDTALRQLAARGFKPTSLSRSKGAIICEGKSADVYQDLVSVHGTTVYPPIMLSMRLVEDAIAADKEVEFFNSLGAFIALDSYLASFLTDCMTDAVAFANTDKYNNKRMLMISKVFSERNVIEKSRFKEYFRPAPYEEILGAFWTLKLLFNLFSAHTTSALIADRVIALLLNKNNYARYWPFEKTAVINKLLTATPELISESNLLILMNILTPTDVKSIARIHKFSLGIESSRDNYVIDEILELADWELVRLLADNVTVPINRRIRGKSRFWEFILLLKYDGDQRIKDAYVNSICYKLDICVQISQIVADSLSISQSSARLMTANYLLELTDKPPYTKVMISKYLTEIIGRD